MKWRCIHCKAINASEANRCHNCSVDNRATFGTETYAVTLLGLDALLAELEYKKFQQSQESTEDQLHKLMVLGNKVGLYDAVDCVRNLLGRKL